MGGLWEVVGGLEKGGVLVRTEENSTGSRVGRLSTGALLEELSQLGGELRFRRLAGQGPAEGWVPLKRHNEVLVKQPSDVWQVLGGQSKGGVLVREGFETSSPALSERLATGSLVRQLERKDDRGWVSIRLRHGAELLVPVDGVEVQALCGSVYDGMDLEVLLENQEKQFSYQGFPSWVRWAAAVARLLREGKPYLPTRLPRPSRIDRPRPLAPYQQLSHTQLAEKSKQHLPGCLFGLDFPLSAEEMASEKFGPAWLTEAFHAAGTLPADNRVTKVLRAEDLAVKGFDAAGGAAMKMFLTVEYEKPGPDLHTELFCKYPYPFDQFPVERRQISSYGDVDGPEIAVQMLLAHLFPFRTAKFYFGDVCRETTNFILISEKIEFSQRGRIEQGKVVEQIDYKPYQVLPVCGKFQDWLLPDPAEYYCCLFRAMGQLAAWDKQGRYNDYFGPLDSAQLQRLAAQRREIKAQQVESQRASVARILDTAIDFMTNVIPSMVPGFLLEGGRLGKIKEDLLEMLPHFPGMSGQYQFTDPNYVAAMHANLQAGHNAFFWRDEHDTLACGVLDWGGFSRMAFCMNFLGCLSGADPEVLVAHEEGIIRCFRDEYARCGGPHLPLDELLLRYHLGYITFVYESTTWVQREIYKLATKEEMQSWHGILDDRFQERFRVRCRSSAIINSFAFYSLKGDYFRKLFKEWSTGKGAPFLTKIQPSSRRSFCSGNVTPAVDVDVIQHHPEGLLVSRGTAGSSKAGPSRGAVFEHGGRHWVSIFEIDRYWFASPLSVRSTSEEVRWISTEPTPGSCLAPACLRRPTPAQADRAQLSKNLSTGVLAVDVLAPIGVGQSMLICGPKDTGKSTLANEVVEYALAARQVDKVVHFQSSSAPPADPTLRRVGTLMQLAVPAASSQSAAYLPALFEAVAVAEEVRDGGKHALLILDTVAPLLDAWELALQLAEAAGDLGDAEALAAQRRAALAALLERAASLQSGGSLTMLALLETEAMAALGIPGQRQAPSAQMANEPTFSLADFRGRRQSELERLQRLQDRGVALTESSLSALGIALPGDVAEGVKSAREMQSLSDGQAVLDKSMAAAGLFPAMVPGASFSRFGLGSDGASKGAEAKARDVRPPALQAVAAHLRTLLALEQEAHFRPTTVEVDSHQSRQLQAVASALQQPPGAPLLPEEMTALLLAACSGALDALSPSEASQALQGGAQSPLLLHLKEAAPGMLTKICQESKLSQATLRELEVVVRLFVKLKQAQV
eukprot:s2916_g8.t2